MNEPINILHRKPQRRKPNERRERFCQLLAQGVPVKIAGREVGYSEKSGRVIGYSPEVRARVRELCVEKLRSLVPIALHKLEGLLQSAELEGVLLQAIRETLSRGGLPEVSALEVSPPRNLEQINADLKAAVREDAAFMRELGFVPLLEGGNTDDAA